MPLEITVIPAHMKIHEGELFQFMALISAGAHDLGSRDANMIWTVSDQQAGTIGTDGGFKAGEIPGRYVDAIKVEVIALVNGRLERATEWASVTILQQERPATVEKISIRPATIVVEPGATTILTAFAQDSAGNLVRGIEFDWLVGDEEAGVVSAGGLFTASWRPGVYPHGVRVFGRVAGAQSDLVFADAELRIVGTLTDISLSPLVATVTEGGQIRFVVEGFDEFKTPISALDLNWEVLDDRSGSVDHLGFFTGGSNPGWYPDTVRVTVSQVGPS